MKKIRSKYGPEWAIRRDIIKFLRARGWWVEIMHGNMYQKGVPDLYAAHPKFGPRWIDAKNPIAYEFTKAQCQKWPIWQQFNIGVWIMTAATEEEYDKLFKEPNWQDYWKPRYHEYVLDVNELLAELLHEENEAPSLPTTSSERHWVPIQQADTGWLDDFNPPDRWNHT